jgi:glycogen phosphorylase
LIAEVQRRTGVALSRDVLSIGFARRATQYKRAELLFHDLDRLREIAATAGSIQLIFAGKAHPRDQGGKDVIRRIFEVASQLLPQILTVYLENYDMALGRLLTAGVDLWLNTPLRPLEASGTSGMKAAHNGVPSLSVLDGWWIEGHIEGVTGWSIGSLSQNPSGQGDVNAEDAQSLYDKLQRIVVPLFYGNRDGWIDVMRQAIALNASFFNTHRMVQQYAASAYV